VSETAQTPDPIPPFPAEPGRRKRTAVIGGLGVLGVAAAAVFGVQAASGNTIAGTATAAPAAGNRPAVVFGGPGGFAGGPGTFGGYAGGTGSTGSTRSAGEAVAAATEATSDQLVGVVDITTVLGYENAEAAGTGMVLTAGGEVLTNNHVVAGATSITVTVLSTGESYDAAVVGTDPADDVAVLQLSDASGLDTVQTDDGTLAVGDAITAVGNAGGEAGTSAAAGTVTGLDQSITATDESGQDAEQLTGLIEVAADVEAGDSGGPLYDAEGEVTGMDTAAASTGGQAYAIPIGTALSIAGQIVDGADDATVHQGYPAFLGVSLLSSGTGGATVAGVVPGGPAAQAGLAAGDVLTVVGGTTVTAPDDVSTALAGRDPGEQVAVSWTDGTGAADSATVTLTTGPAD
jgi:S1-C subfamily serine protease